MGTTHVCARASTLTILFVAPRRWGQAHYSILHRKYKERGHEEEFLMSWKLCSRGHGVLREEAPPSPATTPPPSDALKDGSVVACLACGECFVLPTSF